MHGVEAIAIDEHHAVSFSKPKQYIKYDNFLHLYLIYSEDKLYPVKMGNEKDLNTSVYLGSLTKKRIAYGKFKKYGTYFDGFDKLSFQDRKGSLIVGGCCDMYGIGLGNKNFIPNRHLQYFLTKKDNFYGDIGVSFYHSKNSVFIFSLDPHKVDKLCIGDEIISINGQRVFSKEQLNENILLAPQGENITLNIKRNGVMRVVEVTPFMRPKYPFRDRTYLGRTGMFFGNGLVLSQVTKNSFAFKKGLKKGDKLLEIDFKPVKTTKDIRKALYQGKNKNYKFLFTRNDFQFFITMDKKGDFFALPNCP